MTFKMFLLLLAFLASITSGTAIKCYVCGGSQSSDCAKGKSSAMSVQNCKAPGFEASHRMYSYFNLENSDGYLQSVCLKLFETDYQPKLFIRACGIFPSSVDPCKFLQEHANVTDCKACKTDLCNRRVEFFQEDYYSVNVVD